MRRILAIFTASLLFCSGVANAAVTANSFVSPQTPHVGVQTFVQGTDAAGTFKTIYTGGTNGSKCSALIENNNDTVTHLLTIRVVHSATNVPIIAVTSTATGVGGSYATPTNILSPQNAPGLPLDMTGTPYIELDSGDTLQATFATSLTTSDQINFYAVCSDY
jgi:hypothetical protein